MKKSFSIYDIWSLERYKIAVSIFGTKRGNSNVNAKNVFAANKYFVAKTLVRFF